MKQCPKCGNTYTDDTLRFCLADGENLISIGDETFERAGVRVSIDAPPTQRMVSHPTVASKNSGSRVVKIVVAVLILGFLGLAAIGAGGVIYYMNSGPSTATITPTPTPAPSTTPTTQATSTPDGGMDDMEKELADLQKKLEEMLKEGPGKPTPDWDKDGIAKATVNSPNDGFLALRSQPSAKSGRLLTRIPHGSVITIENCQKEHVTIGAREGRWCMVTYDSATGWVFDAWLEY